MIKWFWQILKDCHQPIEELLFSTYSSFSSSFRFFSSLTISNLGYFNLCSKLQIISYLTASSLFWFYHHPTHNTILRMYNELYLYDNFNTQNHKAEPIMLYTNVTYYKLMLGHLENNFVDNWHVLVRISVFLIVAKVTMVFQWVFNDISYWIRGLCAPALTIGSDN